MGSEIYKCLIMQIQSLLEFMKIFSEEKVVVKSSHSGPVVKLDWIW